MVLSSLVVLQVRFILTMWYVNAFRNMTASINTTSFILTMWT
ncbi:hypothetical protein [Clostridioides difficile]|nr:hypothetical protein [Clostridioides difficile]